MTASSSLPPSAPQITLLGSLISYPLLFYLVTPRNATPERFVVSREAISVLHCSLVTLGSIYELKRQSIALHPSLPRPGQEDGGTRSGYGADSPLITTRSVFGNNLTALETGYLVQDAVILILAARLRTRGQGRKALVKQINWRVLGWHHVGLASALGMLQMYIARGQEKGILVILMLMLMNASTPIGTLHWYLVNFEPSQRRAIMMANAGYLLTYGACRVYIVYLVLQVLGSQTGHTALRAFARLRTSCQVGTATIGMANFVWLTLGVRSFVRRYLSSTVPKKGG